MPAALVKMNGVSSADSHRRWIVEPSLAKIAVESSSDRIMRTLQPLSLTLLYLNGGLNTVRANIWKITRRHPTGGWRWAVLCGLALAPVLADAAWMAVIRPDPITRQSRCLLISETQTTPDGYHSTPVFLALDGASLRVITESELDASFTDLQLVVDKEPPVRSTVITHHKMVLVFDQALPKLIEQFRAGKQVTIYLRFWPTWPVTQSFPVSFSLAGFSKAYDRFTQGCQPTG